MMHAFIKPLLPDLSHSVAEIHRRRARAIKIFIKWTYRREQIDGVNDRKVDVAVPRVLCQNPVRAENIDIRVTSEQASKS
jgi:hypothetical protein